MLLKIVLSELDVIWNCIHPLSNPPSMNTRRWGCEGYAARDSDIGDGFDA